MGLLTCMHYAHALRFYTRSDMTRFLTCEHGTKEGIEDHYFVTVSCAPRQLGEIKTGATAARTNDIAKNTVRLQGLASVSQTDKAKKCYRCLPAHFDDFAEVHTSAHMSCTEWRKDVLVSVLIAMTQ